MADRGDHGSFAEEERSSDRGTPPSDSRPDIKRPSPSQISPSYDLFGNPLLPAAPDAPSQKLTPEKTQLSNREKTASGTGGKMPVSMITYGVFVLCLLAVAGFFGFKAWTGSHGTTSATTTASTNISADSTTTGGATLTPTEIFKTCGPSIVTLTIVTKALQIKSDEFELTATNGDDPILAVVDEDGKPVLYDKGKPAKVAVGIIATPKSKVLVGVKLIGTQPVLIPISEKGDPILKDGKPILISKGVGFKSYTSESIGSGFYVRPDIVATNCHVVSEGPLGAAGFAGGLAQVTDKPGKFTIIDKPIAIDKDHDLALLYVPGAEAKPMKLRSDYSDLKVGESVFALGSPKGLAGSLSEGLISSDKLRGVNPKDPDSPKLYLQHSAKIDHGNSGGPLVDAQGRVIGINTAGMGNGAINLAVVVHFVDDLLNKPDVQAKIDALAKQGQTDLHG
jgi:S1-C subfamily serine protease